MDQVQHQEQGFTKQAQMWAALTHAAALSLFIGIPFGNLLGPLLVWLLKKDQFILVADQGREALNFQLSMTLYALVAALLTVILIGIPLLLLVIVADLVLTIMAVVKANDGQMYRYPLTIRFLN